MQPLTWMVVLVQVLVEEEEEGEEDAGRYDFRHEPGLTSGVKAQDRLSTPPSGIGGK